MPNIEALVPAKTTLSSVLRTSCRKFIFSPIFVSGPSSMTRWVPVHGRYKLAARADSQQRAGEYLVAGMAMADDHFTGIVGLRRNVRPIYKGATSLQQGHLSSSQPPWFVIHFQIPRIGRTLIGGLNTRKADPRLREWRTRGHSKLD
jgi:hypothetical protein